MNELTDSDITWFSLDAELQSHDHEGVSLEEAIEIVGQYFDNLNRDFVTGEEALAATMFGFQRSDGSFLQFCLHSETRIAAWSELASSHCSLVGWFFTQRQVERELGSREDLLKVLRQFYHLDARSFHEAFA